LAFFTPLTMAQIQQTILQGYNAAAGLPADTGPGSSFGPSFNAAALAIFNQQQQVIYVAAIARLSTIPVNPNGTPNPDLDSFCLVFNVPREGASASSGQVTFSTTSPVSGPPVIVPVGAIVQTSSGLQFQVIADPTNSAYNAGDSGYPIGSTYSSVNVTVQCLTTGTIGNVQAGQISNLYGSSTVPVPAQISTVSNAAAFDNAIDFEADPAYKQRFTTTVSTGSVATEFALGGAALGVQPGLTYSIGDRENADGSSHIAYFTLVVAVLGSSTTTPGGILSGVIAALEGNLTASIQPVRAAGISYQVISPTFIAANVGALITLSPGAVWATVEAACIAALTSYIQSIGLNPEGNATTLSYMKLGAILFGVTGVANVDSLLLNSGIVDLTATFSQMFSVGTFTLTTP
jgi:Baseplate J-like protein